jgi:hypothetical protein
VRLGASGFLLATPMYLSTASRVCSVISNLTGWPVFFWRTVALLIGIMALAGMALLLGAALVAIAAGVCSLSAGSSPASRAVRFGDSAEVQAQKGLFRVAMWPKTLDRAKVYGKWEGRRGYRDGAPSPVRGDRDRPEARGAHRRGLAGPNRGR